MIIGWVRHKLEDRWHAATWASDQESIATACSGRWEAQDTAQADELAAAPPKVCALCWRLAEQQKRAEQAIGEAERSGV